MKNLRLICIFCLVLVSCSMPPAYMGDRYTPTNHVDIYYSAGDIPVAYKVMGHITSLKYSKDIVLRNMTYYAEKVGGDAILIIVPDATSGNTNLVSADVLKYK